MKRIKIIFGILSLLLVCMNAFSDGILIIEEPYFPPSEVRIRPRPRPLPKPEPLPVKYHRVDIEINNQVATTHVDQVFLNPYDRDMEGTYIFPLPEESAISEFAMYMDGEKVKGEILERDEARRIYEDIVRRMKDPGLLEYMGRNLFRARVFPIPAHGEKRIELTYHQTLKYDAGMISYRYPLDTERFSPKPIEEVALSVKIKSKTPIKNLYSPSHEIDIKLDEYEAVCGFEEKNSRPDKDFILYYHVSDKDIGLNLFTYRKRPSEAGYFLMLISPGEVKTKSMPKDIVFVLDTSGSMRGGKLKQAKDALKFCIEGLNTEDRFNIVNFATSVNPLAENLLDANKDHKDEALKFIDEFQARGGTNINDALNKALGMFSDSKRPSMLVFLTDGEPTIGVTNIEEILKNTTGANKNKTRLFVFGVGNEVNTHLLDKLADENKGTPEYVTPDENIEVKVSSFYDKISEPVLSDVEIDLGKIKTRDVYPTALPDIFKGAQLVLVGRYTEDGASAITLKGTMNGEKKEFVYEEKFPEENREFDFIPRLWATRKIGYLLSEIRFKGENRELVDEVIELSKEYGIMTPYTSFLVLEPDHDRPLSSVRPTPRPFPQPEERMAAMKQSIEFKSEAFAPSTMMEKSVGSDAVARSNTIMDLKEGEIAQKPQPDRVKHLGDKTFYFLDGFWVDSEYSKEMKIREIKYLSDEYFQILKDKSGLGKYLALGEKLIIVFEGECYKIIE
jgi:Ca-activated chloride channel family protein